MDGQWIANSLDCWISIFPWRVAIIAFQPVRLNAKIQPVSKFAGTPTPLSQGCIMLDNEGTWHLFIHFDKNSQQHCLEGDRKGDTLTCNDFGLNNKLPLVVLYLTSLDLN